VRTYVAVTVVAVVVSVCAILTLQGMTRAQGMLPAAPVAGHFTVATAPAGGPVRLVYTDTVTGLVWTCMYSPEAPAETTWVRIATPGEQRAAQP